MHCSWFLLKVLCHCLSDEFAQQQPDYGLHRSCQDPVDLAGVGPPEAVAFPSWSEHLYIVDLLPQELVGSVIAAPPMVDLEDNSVHSLPALSGWVAKPQLPVVAPACEEGPTSLILDLDL